MNKHFSAVITGAALVAASCGGNQETVVEKVVTDTITKTETVVVEAPIDSAAVAAYYDAAHAKAKGTHQVGHVTHPKTKKQVRVDSHQPIEHYDAVALNTAATAPASDATQPTSTVIIVHDKEVVYFRPDEKASFPGGEKAFDEFIIKNMEYPEAALEYGVSGTVHAEVYLDEQGNVTKVETPGKQIGSGLEDETRRLLKKSPRWNPAKHAGTPVKSKFTIPITFEFKG
jgi:TonB family protein